MRVILDVDTGLDDAVALLLAAGLEEIHIEAVIATNGNVELAKTLENTLNIMETTGCTCPVFRGADRPLVRKPVQAGDFHGKSGLDGPTFPPRRFQQVQQENGVDALIRMVLENPGELTIVSVGPLTDLALAMQKESRFASSVKQLVIMGGSFCGGNVTKEAEFNTYADPEAAQLVFAGKAPIVLFPLDCTSQVTLDDDRLAALKTIEGKNSAVFSACMETYMANYHKKGKLWPQIHDPLCVAYLIDPEKVETEYKRVLVDIHKGPTYGKTTKTDTISGEGITIAKAIDIPWFWSLVERALSTLS